MLDALPRSMGRIRRLVRPPGSPAYAPINDETLNGDGTLDRQPEVRFSWLEYSIFLLQGVAMLWAWNMFLAAAPYFQSRLASSTWLLAHFQPTLLTTSTLANLSTALLLAQRHRRASYPRRVSASLALNVLCFTLLALSTIAFRDVSAEAYFTFVLLIVAAASVAAGMSQNGLFALVAGVPVPEYTQALMTGQAVAGVLPCVAQIASVLAIGRGGDGADDPDVVEESPRAAFAYFMTATAVAGVALLAFWFLMRRHAALAATKPMAADEEDDHDNESETVARKTVSMWLLLRKLRWLALAVFTTFAVTMVFPVFTQEIISVQPDASRLLRPASFIPLAFLVWNAGDLAGRLATLLLPRLGLAARPRLLFVLAVLRVLFVPLYLLCNIRGRGAVVASDLFYLVVVQLPFGFTSGFVGSSCMMAAPAWVDEDEREAAGGFMGLCLVAGLSVGSLLSFLAAQA